MKEISSIIDILFFFFWINDDWNKKSADTPRHFDYVGTPLASSSFFYPNKILLKKIKFINKEKWQGQKHTHALNKRKTT